MCLSGCFHKEHIRFGNYKHCLGCGCIVEDMQIYRSSKCKETSDEALEEVFKKSKPFIEEELKHVLLEVGGEKDEPKFNRSCRTCKFARWSEIERDVIDKSYPGRCECTAYSLEVPACVRVVTMIDGIDYKEPYIDCKFWESRSL